MLDMRSLSLTLTTSDDRKLEVDPVCLAGVSAVFRDMLSMPQQTSEETPSQASAGSYESKVSSTEKISLTVDESSDVFERLITLMQGKTIDIPTMKIAHGLAFAIDKYDMQVLRLALLSVCRDIAARLAADPTIDKRKAWITFVVAAHLDSAVIMVDCLRARVFERPSTWTTAQATAIPSRVYCALIRAWDKHPNWAGMISMFMAEYENAWEAETKAFWEQLG